MKVIDLNLLLYATNQDTPQHAIVREWVESVFNGDEQVGLPWPVLLGFLRLTTRAGLMPNPLSPRQALDVVETWLSQPRTTVLHPGDEHWTILRRLLEDIGAAGNLTSDAHLAAVAIEYGATLCTADADFRRFSGLKTFNPLA